MGVDTSLFPVECVKWDECQAFVKKCRIDGKPVRPPDENEWEYACRAGHGNKQPYRFGQHLSGHEANCNGLLPYATGRKGPDLNRTTKVGSDEAANRHLLAAEKRADC